jgi:hypothetical protein
MNFLLCLFLLTGLSMRAQLINNRAKNIFLSEAAGYYLSRPDDLTLYKNSVIADAASGNVSIYHNMRQAPGGDEQVRSFLAVGVQADVANAFASAYNGRHYENRFGALIKETWIGKPSETATAQQRRAMAALVKGIRYSLQRELSARKEAFELSLADWDGTDQDSAKQIAREKFLNDLALDSAFEYAHRQAEALARTFNYGVISFHWTSVSAYIPLVTTNFLVAPTPSDVYGTHHAYPAHVNLTHTRLWEGSHFGRLFLTLAGDVSLNNSRDAWLLDKRADSGYSGNFRQFVTPAVRLQAVWLPTDSHVGLSFLLQQHFGDFDALNAIIGVPVVLIDKHAEPAINFEFQVRFFDLSNRVATRAGMPGKTSIGMTMGVPFSKIGF